MIHWLTPIKLHSGWLYRHPPVNGRKPLEHASFFHYCQEVLNNISESVLLTLSVDCAFKHTTPTLKTEHNNGSQQTLKEKDKAID